MVATGVSVGVAVATAPLGVAVSMVGTSVDVGRGVDVGNGVSVGLKVKDGELCATDVGEVDACSPPHPTANSSVTANKTPITAAMLPSCITEAGLFDCGCVIVCASSMASGILWRQVYRVMKEVGQG